MMQTLSEKSSDTYLQIKLFQLERLEKTYEDFLSLPEFHKITEFFRKYVYTTRNCEQRNDAFNLVHEKVAGILGEKRIEAATKLKHLNEMTDHLDELMARIHEKLFQNQCVSQSTYEACYVRLENRPERIRQIELLLETTSFSHKLTKFPLLGWGIKMMKFGTKRLGIGFIMEYFEAGYAAFRDIKNIEPFLHEIKKREFCYLNRLLP